jgi:beta-lactamase superfamily II metal-dependent hydrolase
LRNLKSEDGMGRNIDHLASRLVSFGSSSLSLGLPNIWATAFPAVSEQWFWNAYPGFVDENNLSLVYVLRIHGTCFLFPGDMECAGWENVLAGQADLRRAVAECHVLVASHHGRQSGICPKMFDVYGCKPQIVIISDDYRRFDTQNTTSYYHSRCSGIQFRYAPRRVLTTRSDGKITFTWSAMGDCTCN